MVEIAAVGRSSSRGEEAVRVIEDRISQMATGERLGDKESVRQMTGVSPGTLNEALRLLVSRGTIVVRPGPGGGVFVARPSPFIRLGHLMFELSDTDLPPIHDAVRVRDALEFLINEDAAVHRKPADGAALRRLIKKFRKHGHTSDGRFSPEVVWDLHGRIAAITPNQILQRFYIGLMDIIASQTGPIHPGDRDAEYLNARVELHEQIVEAIIVGDVPGVRKLTELHALSTQQPYAPTQ